ncbi:MAG: hypothetical protein MdMp014T_0303 [Treponematales bacterium]
MNELTQKEMRMKAGSEKIFWVIVFALGVSALLAMCFGGGKKEAENPDAWKAQDSHLEAEVMLREFVKQRLKSPATAKFATAFDPERKIQNEADQKYLVTSFVDSQNSFGATIRTYFVGEIQQISKGEWKLLSLEFFK